MKYASIKGVWVTLPQVYRYIVARHHKEFITRSVPVCLDNGEKEDDSIRPEAGQWQGKANDK